MKLDVLEKGKEKITMEIKGETHTFLNLLRENSWKLGCDQASYVVKHPYLSEPRFTIRSKNPLKTLESASQMIMDQAKEFESLAEKTLK